MKKAIVPTVLLALAALALPGAASAASITYGSSVNLATMNGQPASFAVDYYNPDGRLVDETIGTTPATLYPVAPPAAFGGSAVMSSPSPLGAIINITGNGGVMGAAYAAPAGGAATLNLPLVMKNNYNIYTWTTVQNEGSSSASVTVAYRPGACSDSATLQPGGSYTFYQTANTCLPSGFVGAASVTNAATNQPLEAVVLQVAPESSYTSLEAYAAFTDAPTAPLMPSVSSNWYYSATSINVENTGGQSTSVTVTYAPSAGFPGKGCLETHTVPAGGTATFAYPQLPAGCGTTWPSGVTDSSNGGFVGSGAVTANSANQPLATIVNTVTRNAASADSYQAINPADATSHVNMPLIMDRNYNNFTGIAVANVGAQATSITCTFWNTTYQVSQSNVAPGAALTAVQLDNIANGHVGSGTCTASGGDAKIAAIVNEARQNSPSTTDALYIYNAFNY